MKFYKTKTAVRFFSGTILGLSEEQAQDRLQAKQIERLAEQGKFAVLTEVHFKAGEVIGLEEDVAKDLIAPFPVFTPKLIPVEEEKK
jgi:hypothetical protein